MSLMIWTVTVGMDACSEWIEERMIGEKSKTWPVNNIFKSDLPLRGARNRTISGLGRGSEHVFNRLNNSMLI